MVAPKISIIVPVYNVEQYLRQCIDSILAQTFTDWECILVDDGSKDESGSICDEYEKADNRIRAVHQTNGGSSAARNVGLQIARGEYISFVDSDDWLECNYLESMYDIAIINGSNFVICGFYMQYPNARIIPIDNKPSNIIGEIVIKESLEGHLHAGLWNKLIKKDLFDKNGITFPKYNYYEDMNVTICLASNNPQISYCDKKVYNYRVNPESQTYHVDVAKKFRQFEEFVLNMEDVMKRYDFRRNAIIIASFYKRVNDYKYGMMISYYFCHEELGHMLSFFPESVNWETSRGRKLTLKLASDYHLYFPILIVKAKREALRLVKDMLKKLALVIHINVNEYV